MTHRKKALYKKVFKFLRDQFHFKPDKVMSDFESGMRNAITQIWINAHISGCFFHYKQALRRKFQSLGMKKIINSNRHAAITLKMIMSLPLLPKKFIIEGFSEVISYQKRHQLTKKFLAFNKYFYSNWFKGLQSYDINDHRTNNYAESFNAKLKRKIQKNPSTFMFLSKH